MKPKVAYTVINNYYLLTYFMFGRTKMFITNSLLD